MKRMVSVNGRAEEGAVLQRQTEWKDVEGKEGRNLRGSRIRSIDGAVHISYPTIETGQSCARASRDDQQKTLSQTAPTGTQARRLAVDVLAGQCAHLRENGTRHDPSDTQTYSAHKPRPLQKLMTCIRTAFPGHPSPAGPNIARLLQSRHVGCYITARRSSLTRFYDYPRPLH